MNRGLGGPATVALVAALVASPLALGGTGAGAARAAPAGTGPPCTFDYCVGDEVPGPRPPVPGRPAHPRPPTPGRGAVGSTPPAPVCRWDIWTQAVSAFPVIPDPPSGEAQLYLERCDGELTGRVRWVEPGQPPPAPRLSPAELAEMVRVRLEGNLPRPVVTSSPRPGVAALIGFPTFVAVENWRGAVRDRECDPNSAPRLCVSVVATPRLEWAPGEPGAAIVACADAGTVFDPGGASPDEQAAVPGACAYAYRARTGVLGRPGTWPGEVTVRWELRWSSTAGGGGSLPEVTKTAAVPRAVDEVQTLIETAG